MSLPWPFSWLSIFCSVAVVTGLHYSSHNTGIKTSQTTTARREGGHSSLAQGSWTAFRRLYTSVDWRLSFTDERSSVLKHTYGSIVRFYTRETKGVAVARLAERLPWYPWLSVKVSKKTELTAINWVRDVWGGGCVSGWTMRINWTRHHGYFNSRRLLVGVIHYQYTGWNSHCTVSGK